MNKILCVHFPEYEEFSIIDSSGVEVQNDAFADDLDFYFNPYTIAYDLEGGVWVIESHLETSVDYYGDVDCWFEFTDVREPTNWEWDDIIELGYVLWPNYAEPYEEDLTYEFE